ncbi:ras GEF [Phanerochaete sordida]|uniref:Ras GEF n=1 Tax=Phanerochaete sordida TaxID=48140 RepID=A0A9P3L9L8_9APHY|nr:ras GEF [Phanerochaete sordida]
MTTNIPHMDLPEIPSLPPIEMPSSSFLDPSDYVNDRASLSPLNPSSVSLVSQDTFMTADSSISSELNMTPMTNSPELLSPSSPLALAPPSSLRKSISVDSFVNYRPPSDPATRANRGNTMSATAKPKPSEPYGQRPSGSHDTDPRASSGSSMSRHEPDHFQRRAGPSRSRGTSISTNTGDEYESSLLDDSDVERSEDMINVSRKGKTPWRRHPQAEELSLPSRLSTVSSSPTMGKAPPPIVPERTSSLGQHRLTKQRSLISVNTQIPPSPHQSDVTLVVVGAAGSGKSTIIRKGLKSYGLSEASSSMSPRGVEGERFRYIYRVGRISYNQATDRLLRVLEVDTPPGTHGDGQRGFLPEGAPPIDGLVICYDASEESTFTNVEGVLQSMASLKLPTIVFACKSDLDRRVEPRRVQPLLEGQYDVGLIEVTTRNTLGKEKIRTAFEWIFKAIFTQKLNGAREGYRNPASPAILSSPTPWDVSRTSSATPTGSSSTATHSPLLPPPRIRSPRLPPQLDDPLRTPRTPISPTRTRSMSDLLSERGQDWDGNLPPTAMADRNRESSRNGLSAEGPGKYEEVQENPPQSIASRESRPPSWMTLDELLDKLLFVAVSDDDPTFISHFLLTYRRFAAPRSLLLSMQKRMRALEGQTSDPMFACYAQMKICALLDHWIQLYPNDFAVPNTAGALSALIKSVMGKTYLLHYGSEFIPFMEILPTLKDPEVAWAMKIAGPKDESDDANSLKAVAKSSATTLSLAPPVEIAPLTATSKSLARERKHSLPLSARILVMETSPTHIGLSDSIEHSPQKKLKILVSLSNQFMQTDPTSLAQEISRLESTFFLQIEPRHWLRRIMDPGVQDAEIDPITQYNNVSNHLAEWVVSLILCHDKPKMRARVLFHLVELASRLRNMNNYSGLRSIVAGINHAALDYNETKKIFKRKENRQYKLLQSFDQLLQAMRAHSKYRLALRNSKGACIPATEIHLSDLLRAHEANVDFLDDDPNHIHWAKFNMIGRFIDAIAQCQASCRETKTYERFPEDVKARELLLFNKENLLMDQEMKEERLKLDQSEDAGQEDDYLDDLGTTRMARESPTHTREGLFKKKIPFW